MTAPPLAVLVVSAPFVGAVAVVAFSLTIRRWVAVDPLVGAAALGWSLVLRPLLKRLRPWLLDTRPAVLLARDRSVVLAEGVLARPVLAGAVGPVSPLVRPLALEVGPVVVVIADAVAIAKSAKPTVICSWEISHWLEKKGVENCHPMNTGGHWIFDFGKVKCVSAIHSSGLPDGTYGGSAMGFLVETPHGNFYYSGDTALHYDMKLIGEYKKINFAFLPLGNGVVHETSTTRIN
jgi:hypothetical protein